MFQTEERLELVCEAVLHNIEARENPVEREGLHSEPGLVDSIRTEAVWADADEVHVCHMNNHLKLMFSPHFLQND